MNYDTIASIIVGELLGSKFPEGVLFFALFCFYFVDISEYLEIMMSIKIQRTDKIQNCVASVFYNIAIGPKYRGPFA